MTAIHWAPLKGHEQPSEMLMDVGAVHLLQVPDSAGDTPIALAMRKKNRYIVMYFHKCLFFQAIFGRPHIQRRFPKNRGKFWFLQGFGILSCLNNCFNYWLLNMENDAEDFLGSSPQDGSLATEREAPLPSMNRDLSRS